MEEKKVLYVISEFFAPYHSVASIKFTKITKFLAQKQEYKIYVFTRKNYKKEDDILNNDLLKIESLGGEVFVIDAGKNFYKTRKIEKTKLYKRFFKKTDSAKKYRKLHSRGMARFAKNGIRLIDENKIPAPDYVISTYDDYGAHMLGMKIKQRYGENVKWITDFRDQVAIFYQDKKTREWADEYTLKVSEMSDCTTVSFGMAQNMVFADKTDLRDIHIGFDYADGQKAKTIHKALTFTYSGSYYGNRTIRPLLQVISELIDEGLAKREDFAFNYCGVMGSNIKKELDEFNLSNNYVDWGRVSHLQSLLIQESSDILLSCIWNYYDYQGAIGGKTFEYLGLEKPIVAIVRGDMPESDMKKLIVRGECGVCYEEANHDEDIVRLKEKIYQYYTEKIKNGHIEHHNKYEEVRKYDLSYIANQYDELLKA